MNKMSKRQLAAVKAASKKRQDDAAGWPKYSRTPMETFARRIGMRRFDTADRADMLRVQHRGQALKSDKKQENK